MKNRIITLIFMLSLLFSVNISISKAAVGDETLVLVEVYYPDGYTPNNEDSFKITYAVGEQTDVSVNIDSNTGSGKQHSLFINSAEKMSISNVEYTGTNGSLKSEIIACNKSCSVSSGGECVIYITVGEENYKRLEDNFEEIVSSQSLSNNNINSSDNSTYKLNEKGSRTDTNKNNNNTTNKSNGNSDVKIDYYITKQDMELKQAGNNILSNIAVGMVIMLIGVAFIYFFFKKK